MTAVSLEHRTEMRWSSHPLALSSKRTHSKPQRSPEDTKISPALKVPQGRRAVASPESASVPPGSEILLEVDLQLLSQVERDSGFSLFFPPPPPLLPASFLGTRVFKIPSGLPLLFQIFPSSFSFQRGFTTHLLGAPSAPPSPPPPPFIPAE